MILVAKRFHKFFILNFLLSILFVDSFLYGAVVLNGRTMGTSYSVKLSKLPPGKTHKQLKKLIDQSLEQVNDQMSTYRPKSELSRFNTFDKSGWFEVSTDTARVAQRAKEIGRLLAGSFDVTIGMVVNLWGFGPRGVPTKIPSDKQLKQVLEKSGNDQLSVRMSPPAIKKKSSSLYVDLSGIAKGFGADKVSELLSSLGSRSHMVEIGGEVATVGLKASSSPWRIAIERPNLHGKRGIQSIAELSGQSLATSGDYRNFFEKNGKRFSHIIDPRTGKPVDHKLASVSVISSKCLDADAFATGMMVLGFKEGMKLAKKNKLAVFFLLREKGGYVGYSSPEFKKYWKKK